MSALGQKRTFCDAGPMSALVKQKLQRKSYVRFTPKSGHVRYTSDVRFVPIADMAPFFGSLRFQHYWAALADVRE